MHSVQNLKIETDFTLGNYLFGCVKLSKNADPDKYKYTGYTGIRFDSCSELFYIYLLYFLEKMSLVLVLI